MQFQRIYRDYTKDSKAFPRKKNSLLRLCCRNDIPPEYHAWYQALPIDEKKRNTIPEPTASERDTESTSDLVVY